MERHELRAVMAALGLVFAALLCATALKGCVDAVVNKDIRDVWTEIDRLDERIQRLEEKAEAK